MPVQLELPGLQGRTGPEDSLPAGGGRRAAARLPGRCAQPRTFLQVLLQPSPPGIQLLLRQGERPLPRQPREGEVGEFPFQVLVQDGKLAVPLGAELAARHVHVVHLQGAEQGLAGARKAFREQSGTALPPRSHG